MTHYCRHRVHIFTCAFLLTASTVARGGETIRISDSAGFTRAVGAARPGDTILLAPGNYASNFFFRGVHGAPGQPIVIAAADPDRPPRLTGDGTPLHISGTSYLELRDLIISGSHENGLNLDDDNNPDTPAHHITLRKIRVEKVGPTGNVDGIKLSGVEDFLVTDCSVERWGSGGSAMDLVGCHRGVIVNCDFRKGGENAVQLKGGSLDVTVRKCRFEDAGDRAVNIGGLTANQAFRPRLTKFPAGGFYEAKGIVVEGCTIIRGEAAVAFVNADAAVVRYNTIYLPQKYAFRILEERVGPEFLPCRKGKFENNIVVFRSEKWVDGGVNVGAYTLPKTFAFANNFWYCEDRPDQSEPKLPRAETGGVYGMNPHFAAPSMFDFSVPADSPARSRGAGALPEKAK